MKNTLPPKPPEGTPPVETAADVPSLGDEAQMVITVQISKNLQPELFAELTRAKKRDRAERVRWLCQGGLNAERQVARHANFATDDRSAAKHKFTPLDPRHEPEASQLLFPDSSARPSTSGKDDPPSLISHADIGALLL